MTKDGIVISQIMEAPGAPGVSTGMLLVIIVPIAALLIFLLCVGINKAKKAAEAEVEAEGGVVEAELP